MNTQEKLQQVLDGLLASVPDIRGAVLASRDGLLIASTFATGEGSRVAAMAATVEALGDRVTELAELGELAETAIQSDVGTFVVYSAGSLATLALVARGGANLGLVHIEGRRVAATVEALFDAAATTTPREAAHA